MLFLDSCQNIEVLKIIYFVKQLIQIVLIIIPIGLILFIIFDLLKSLTYNGSIAIKKSDELNYEMGKGKSIALKRILYTILLFFVPSIVNISLKLLETSSIKTEYLVCYNKATKTYIDAYQIVVDQQELEKQKAEEMRLREKINNIPQNDNEEKIYYFDATTVTTIKREILKYAANQIGKSNNSEFNYQYTFGDGSWDSHDWGWCAAFVTSCIVQTAKEKNLEVPFRFEVFPYEPYIGQHLAGSLHWQSVFGYGVAFGMYSFNDSYMANDKSFFAYSEEYRSECGYAEQNGEKINKEGNYIPQTGDIIMFTHEPEIFENSCSYQWLGHIGLVESSDSEKNTVTFIHGNTNGCCEWNSCVCRKTIQLSDTSIAGYGVWE